MFLYALNRTALATFFTQTGLPQLGISHITDIPFVLDEVSNINASTGKVSLANQVTALWTRFASSGFPSASGKTDIEDWQAAWKARGQGEFGSAKIMVMGGGDAGLKDIGKHESAIHKDNLVERCNFLLTRDVIKEVGT